MNPAGLTELQGMQLYGSLNLALLDACFEPYGYYGWGLGNGDSRDTPERAALEGRPLRTLILRDPDTGQATVVPTGRDPGYYRDPLDTVCMDQNLVPVPQLVFGARVTDRLGIALGLAYPAAQPTGRWGGPQGVVRGASGEPRPAATRYMQLETGNRAFFPTVGFGLQLARFLRVGASFTWGIYVVDTTTMSSSGGGTDPLNHVITRVEAEDYFVPIGAASVHLVPIDPVDVVVGFRYHDTIHASGQMTATTGVYRNDFLPHTGPPITLNDVEQRMPWVLSFGARYAARLTPRTYEKRTPAQPNEPVDDPMSQERWDVELDVEFQRNARNQEQVLRYAPSAVEFVPASTGVAVQSAFPPPGIGDIRIPKAWRDQWSVRLGGSYNVVRNVLALSAGAHYENRGVDPAYAQIDFWPFQRLGLHAGITVRVMGKHDLILSYAHIFQETLTVAAPEHGSRLMGGFDKTVDPLPPRGQAPPEPLQERRTPTNPDGIAARRQVVTQTTSDAPATIINAGIFRSSYDVFAVALHLHF